MSKSMQAGQILCFISGLHQDSWVVIAWAILRQEMMISAMPCYLCALLLIIHKLISQNLRLVLGSASWCPARALKLTQSVDRWLQTEISCMQWLGQCWKDNYCEADSRPRHQYCQPDPWIWDQDHTASGVSAACACSYCARIVWLSFGLGWLAIISSWSITC